MLIEVMILSKFTDAAKWLNEQHKNRSNFENFARMLADEGRWKGRQIIQSATLKEMYTNQLGSTKNSSRGFQLGRNRRNPFLGPPGIEHGDPVYDSNQSLW